MLNYYLVRLEAAGLHDPSSKSFRVNALARLCECSFECTLIAYFQHKATLSKSTVVILLRQVGVRHPLRCYSKITFIYRLKKMKTFEYVCFKIASPS